MYKSVAAPLLQTFNFKKYFLFLLFGLFFASVSIAQNNNSGKLIIEVNNINNNKGKIGVSVFNSSDGFPNATNKAKYLVLGNIAGNASRIEIENMPFGEYAVSIIHDENENNKLETNFLGIPNEGIGMSNDAKGTFGPPNFEQAKFKFSKNNQAIQINTVYY
jgi:uncharacterized protein (DUF2141 family)